MKIYILYRSCIHDIVDNNIICLAHSKNAILTAIQQQIESSPLDENNMPILSEKNFSVLAGKLGQTPRLVCHEGEWAEEEALVSNLKPEWKI